jgi:SAM-dependent methyltransferase
MKLNAGCGYKKLNGYLNIDINPDVKPDYVMDVCALGFSDKYFDEVNAEEVIEHLGFFRTKYFFSEINRVLKNGGKFIIETPHIEKSFEIFLSSESPDDREKILGWIYGSESMGMGHRYCFPVELMNLLFDEFGFELLSRSFFDYETLRPAVRYIILKKTDYKKAELRKALFRRNIFFADDEIYLNEYEGVIKRLDLEKIDSNFIIESAFISPILSLAIGNCVDKREYDDILKTLYEKKFTGWLFDLCLDYEKESNDIENAYEKIKKLFFNDPLGFINDFIKNKKTGSRDIFLFNKNTLHYESNRIKNNKRN